MALPFESRTTTGTITRFTLVLKVAGASRADIFLAFLFVFVKSQGRATPSRNLDHAVARRHSLSFRIPHHQPDYVAAWRHVEVGLDGYAGIQQLFERRIAQAQLNHLLHTTDELSIAV